MNQLNFDQVGENTLDAMSKHFYGGDLVASFKSGLAFLNNIGEAPLSRGAHTYKAQVLLWMVRCARREDKLNVALEHAFSGIEAARSAGNTRLECQLQAQYVHVLASLGQNQTGLKEGYKVLRFAVASGDAFAQAACWLALGQVHWTMQQWRDGEDAYTKALTLARACGDEELCGLASNGMAAMEDHYATEARAAGRTEDAKRHAFRSFALLEEFTINSRQIGDGYNAWIGAYNQASCLFGMGNIDAARKLLDTQLQILDGDRGSRYNLILQVLGAIHSCEGKHELAIACHTEALGIAVRLKVPMLAMDACEALVNTLERSGDSKSALARHRQYHAMYVQLASERALAQASAMGVIYETEKTRAFAETERQRAEQLAIANISLVQEKAVLQRNSMEDALTGLANRRRFDEALGLTSDGEGVPLNWALAMIDVDHFKHINDHFSHQVGDDVLRILGSLLLRYCRKQDLAARYGGEEFALILCEVNAAMAMATCERLRAAVEAEPWFDLRPQLHVTISIGVVHAADCAPSNLLTTADSRLYEAKHRGRNNVVGSFESIGHQPRLGR